MNTSNETTNLWKAMYAFHSKVNAVKKTAKNDHFHSTYADLNSILTTINPVLQDLGMIVTQHPQGEVLITRVIHVESGEWMQSEQFLRMKDDNNVQHYGSALTYSRRYALASIFSLNQSDDDGNSASGHKVKAVKEWLTPSHKMWQYAVDHMKKGKSIKDIEEHYGLQPDVKKQLMDIKK